MEYHRSSKTSLLLQHRIAKHGLPSIETSGALLYDSSCDQDIRQIMTSTSLLFQLLPTRSQETIQLPIAPFRVISLIALGIPGALVLQERLDSVGSQLFATREPDQFDAEQASSDLCLVMLDQPAARTDSSAGGE